MKIVIVCGARPNFMKVAPVIHALRRASIDTTLVHTGQHYDRRMSCSFFAELKIPEPDVNLEVGSSSHAIQTGEIMKRFEAVCLDRQPGWVIVVGDVNSTLAAALVAVKLGIKIAHVEAGLRSFDRSMPEEINRTLTDAISELLFVTEPSGVENLRREGVNDTRIHLVGNVMVDTLLANRTRAERSTILTRLSLERSEYVLATLHRPSNVDDRKALDSIALAMEIISEDLPVILPVHPRTRCRLDDTDLGDRLRAQPNIRLIEPLGYLDFLKLMASAAVVLTDSGGVQEETTVLSIPCLTLRENTERPVTITQGTNRLTGSHTDTIVTAYRDVRANPPSGRIPALWDGRAAERIVEQLLTADQAGARCLEDATVVSCG